MDVSIMSMELGEREERLARKWEEEEGEELQKEEDEEDMFEWIDNGEQQEQLNEREPFTLLLRREEEKILGDMFDSDYDIDLEQGGWSVGIDARVRDVEQGVRSAGGDDADDGLLLGKEIQMHIQLEANSNTSLTTASVKGLAFCVVKAASDGCVKTVEDLLRLGKEHGVPAGEMINREAVMMALHNGHLDMLEVLHSAIPEMVSWDLGSGVRLLRVAVQCRLDEKELVRRRTGGEDGGKDEAEEKVDSKSQRRLDIVRLLLQNGADPNFTSHAMDYRLLYLASSHNDTDLVDLLLAHGADILGSGAMHAAAMSDAVEVMGLLVERGANVDDLLHRRILETPLHVAVGNGMDRALAWLLDHGADGTIRDGLGRTAFGLLCDEGMMELRR